ncbi:hypothetical protein KUV85_13690 [Nocardioides panacisoli]|uniref:hypothetical protein n=1 Tax=Nocardioides panacisoli TaxID=627624 RepID=UPI001C6281E8|nr:hypothetical protein [Nocardioides panacisoli]QYJ03374.1 hypothetical protein KUV85_13690 [Nocardioides panacisoli]
MSEATAFEQFGSDFLRIIFHRRRIADSVARVLGPGFELGPIGAGPTRRLAKVTARGTYRTPYADNLPGELPAFRVTLPVDVDFTVGVAGSSMTFHADVIVPLLIRFRLEHPLVLHWDVTPPGQDDILLKLDPETRRSAALQRFSTLEADLRGFLIRFVDRELHKEHVQRATRIDLEQVIDGSWEALAAQFLPPWEPTVDSLEGAVS